MPDKAPRIDPWARLRAATPARIGLGRTGDSLSTREVLAFQTAHARARDAVHARLDIDSLSAALAPRPMLHVASRAGDRAVYLRRPDLGRQLDPQFEPLLNGGPFDVAFVIADGLSATAVQAHAAAVLNAALEHLPPHLSVAPVVIVENGRVAIGDEVAEALNARVVVILIGERPGLSVPDSLGAYLTYAPKRGMRDSQRNCISNIHHNGGLSYRAAAEKIVWLVEEMLTRRLSGVGLKDDLPQIPEPRRIDG
jgi:ethanolamine ammonia-lyase small subunit